jgi:putative tryptophan/tyrosine transport system substrate-binding protein
VAWPLAARAQQPQRVRRIGVLIAFAADDPEMQARIAALRQGLESLGWSEGRNLRIDYRYAPGNPEQVRASVKELIDLQPDLIFAHSTPVIAALQRGSRTIPIVFVEASDPIGSGFVASLPRPGGNLTGFLLIEASITGKWLGMLKEIAPRLARAAIMVDPKGPTDYFLEAGAAVAPSLSIEVVPTRVETAADIESAIVSFARTPNGGLVVPPGATTTQSRDLIVALSFPRSARSATPHFSSYPQAGRLITPSFPGSGGDRIKPGARCDTLELANTCSQCSWNTSQFQYV